MTTRRRSWSQQRGRVLAMCGSALLLSVPAPAQDEAATAASPAGLAKAIEELRHVHGGGRRRRSS